MKRLYLLFCGLMFSLLTLNAQTQVSFSENFDGATHTFTSNGWQLTTDYASSGTKSMRGDVPFYMGDSIELISPMYDFTNYSHVQMQFSHICKVSNSDIAKVQYRLNAVGAQGQWQDIPMSAYKSGSAYINAAFSSISYSDWVSSDSLAIPTNAWWKQETFDLSNEVSYEKVQFRFLLKKTSSYATYFNYGWLIDDFSIIASLYEIATPVVEFTMSLTDSIVGPYNITAKVATRSNVPIITPVLHYFVSNAIDGVINDSIVMTMEKDGGDSLWFARVPAYRLGSSYIFSLTGQDSAGNSMTKYMSFATRVPSYVQDSSSARMFSHTVPYNAVIPDSVPIVVTFQNRGLKDLTSAIFGYSVNDEVQDSNIVYQGHLPTLFWDSIQVGTLHLNTLGRNSIKVWIKMPNGVIDPETDKYDTLTFYIDGCTDIYMNFGVKNLHRPNDTVHSVGPYDILMHLGSRTGLTPLSWAKMAYTVMDKDSNITKRDTLPITTNIKPDEYYGLYYGATIPCVPFGSKVYYTAFCVDYKGNLVSISDSYTILKHVNESETNTNVYAGDSTNNSWRGYGPYDADQTYGWSRMLYLSNELGSGGTITNLAFKLEEWDYDNTFALANQSCYMKVVSDIELQGTSYIDPITAGATLVWSDTIPDLSPYYDYWVDIELQTPFTVPQGSNLLIYWVSGQNANASGHGYNYYWYYSKALGSTGAYDYNKNVFVNYYGSSPNANGVGTLRQERPIARFVFTSSQQEDSIDVKLLSMTSPQYNAVIAAGSYPIKVVIRNTGIKYLDSCNLAYTINGGSPITYKWTGHLSPDFVDTITIGTFNAVAFKANEIQLWVESSTTFDDSLVYSISACNGEMTGTFTIGDSASNFANFDQFHSAALNCGINGKVTLAFAKGTYPPINIERYSIGGTSIGNIMELADTLVFTSQSGNAADVVFASYGSGYCFNMGMNDNVYLQNITLDATNSTGSAFRTSSNYSNIEISNCIINMNSQYHSYNYTNRYCGIYVQTITNDHGFDGDFRILNNTINGGDYGCLLSPPSNVTTYDPNRKRGSITIKGNTFNNFKNYGVYASYGNQMMRIKTIANNNFNFGPFDGSTTAIEVQSMRVDSGVIGNKIHIIVDSNSNESYGNVTGIRALYLNNPSLGFVRSSALVANNEIMCFSSNNSYISFNGICCVCSPLNIYHNTIYSYGNSDEAYFAGLILYNDGMGSSDTLNIKNNQIIAEGLSYNIPFANDLSLISYYPIFIDYNNYYSDNDSLLLQRYQSLRSGQDIHSVSVKPMFVDSLHHTNIHNFNDYWAPTVGISEDILGVTRYNKTTMGAYTINITDFTPKLAMVEFIGLKEIDKELCNPDYRSIKVAVANNGYASIDFSQTPLNLTLEVSGGDTLTINTTINSGIVEMGDIDTVEITNMLDVRSGLAIDLKAYLTCAADTIYVSDDTTYTSISQTKFNLPIDEDFTNDLPNTLHVLGNNTTDSWAVTIAKNNVTPQFGGKMLAFDGIRGAESKLYTTAIDLSNTFNPTLDFWYYHDTASNVVTGKFADVTEVGYTTDNGLTYKSLIKLTKNNGVDMGWKKYSIALDSAVGNSCVVILFNALRMSSSEYNGEQYLDRIIIKVKQDLSLTSLSVPELTSCDYTGKEFGIVMGNETSQDINFESSPTSLQVNITGDTTLSYNIPLNSGIIHGLNNDTLIIDNSFDFNPGIYYVYAKVVTSIDETPANDVLYDTIIVNPSIDVVATQVTGGNDNTNCISIGSLVNQVVTLENDGNMDMEDVILTLNVYDITGAKVQTIEDTLAGVFAINQTTTYTFAEAYEVPEDVMYNVEIIANPMCNASLTYTDVLTECVDQSDIEVSAFINPTDDETCSSVGENIKVKVRVSNNNPNEDASGVVLHAIVTTNGNTIASWTETLDDISADDYIDFEFPQGFNVPSEADYTIVAYVNSVDAKTDNDTLSMTKCTDLGLAEQAGNAIFLGQNIPNPATSQTLVNYQVPTDGKVVFTLTTVTGQVIYTTTQEVEAGHNSVEFNTESLAAGIYFYTMDFNGQRLTKKMTIRK